LGRLVAYDLKLLGKAVRAALSRKGDILFVLIAAPLVAVSAVHLAGQYPLPPPARALLVATIAFAANLAIRRRRDHLEEPSRLGRRHCWQAQPPAASHRPFSLAGVRRFSSSSRRLCCARTTMPPAAARPPGSQSRSISSPS
jgi:hypothetical protein